MHILNEAKKELMWEEKEKFLDSLKKEAKNSISEILYVDVISYVQDLDKKDFKKFKKIFLQSNGDILKAYKHSKRMTQVKIFGQVIPSIVASIAVAVGINIVAAIALVTLFYGTFLYLGLKLFKGNMILGIIFSIIIGSILNSIAYNIMVYSAFLG